MFKLTVVPNPFIYDFAYAFDYYDYLCRIFIFNTYLAVKLSKEAVYNF